MIMLAAAIQLHIQGPLGPRIKEISIFSSFCTLAHFLPIYAVLVKFFNLGTTLRP